MDIRPPLSGTGSLQRSVNRTMGRTPTRPPRSERDAPPDGLPDVPPSSRQQGHTHDFTLKAVIEMQRSLGDLCAKVDRLIVDVGKQSEKVSELRDTVSFVRGAIWVIGILGVVVVPFLTWLLNHSYPPNTVAPVSAASVVVPAPVSALPTPSATVGPKH